MATERRVQSTHCPLHRHNQNGIMKRTGFFAIAIAIEIAACHELQGSVQPNLQIIVPCFLSTRCCLLKYPKSYLSTYLGTPYVVAEPQPSGRTCLASISFSNKVAMNCNGISNYANESYFSAGCVCYFPVPDCRAQERRNSALQVLAAADGTPEKLHLLLV